VQTVFQPVDHTQPVDIGGLDRAIAVVEPPKSKRRR